MRVVHLIGPSNTNGWAQSHMMCKTTLHYAVVVSIILFYFSLTCSMYLAIYLNSCMLSTVSKFIAFISSWVSLWRLSIPTSAQKCPHSHRTHI